MMLGTDEGREQCAEHLLDGVALDSSFSAVLSDDLLERIDETIGGLEHVSSAGDHTELDRGLQYTQFWRTSTLMRSLPRPLRMAREGNPSTNTFRNRST